MKCAEQIVKRGALFVCSGHVHERSEPVRVSPEGWIVDMKHRVYAPRR